MSEKSVLVQEVRPSPTAEAVVPVPRIELTAAPTLQPLETPGRESGSFSWVVGLGVILGVLLLAVFAVLGGRKRKS